MKKIIITTICIFAFTTLLKAQTGIPDNTTGPIFIKDSKVGIGTNNPQHKLDVNGAINATNIFMHRGYFFSPDLDKIRPRGLYTVVYRGSHSDALLDIGGFKWSTPRFQLMAHFADRLFFRAARDSEDNWENKGFREIIMANEQGNVGIGTTDPKYKLDVNGDINATNIFMHRGYFHSPDLDKIRPRGLYTVVYSGSHTDALLDINGFRGSTPRFQLMAHFADRLFFRAARDSEDNWENKGFREIIMANEHGNVGIGTNNPIYAKLQIRGGATHKLFAVNRPNNDIPVLYLGNDGTANAVIASNNAHLTFGKDYSGRYTEYLRIVNENGNVGIGTTNPKHKLDVNGIIHAKEVKVDLNGWSDFVFADGYDLPDINEVAQYIETHKHLPDVPTATEVKEKGISLGKMNAKLLQKIEELTLYTIKQEKELKELKKLKQKNSELELRLEKLERLLETANQ